MKQLLKIIPLLFICSFFTYTAKAQVADTLPETPYDTSLAIDPNIILPKANNLFNTKFSFLVPNPTANASFNKSMIGIYQVNGSLNLSLYKALTVGVVFGTGNFKIDRNIIRDYNAHMNFYNAGVRLGTDVVFGEKNRKMFAADVAVGQTYVNYSSFVCKTPGKKMDLTDFKSPFLEIGSHLIFLIESNWGLGITLDYTLFQKTFDPYELCLDDWGSFSKTNKGPTQYFSFGFTGHYSFLAK